MIVTSFPEQLWTCLACGSRMEPCLVRAGSPRCHDCRDTHAPLRSELAEGDGNVQALPLVSATPARELRRAA